MEISPASLAADVIFLLTSDSTYRGAGSITHSIFYANKIHTPPGLERGIKHPSDPQIDSEYYRFDGYFFFVEGRFGENDEDIPHTLYLSASSFMPSHPTTILWVERVSRLGEETGGEVRKVGV